LAARITRRPRNVVGVSIGIQVKSRFAVTYASSPLGESSAIAGGVITGAAVTARACANIALAKYWGKASDDLKLPAVPSLSVTLDGLLTTTTVTHVPGRQAGAHTFSLQGQVASMQSASAHVPEGMRRVLEVIGQFQRGLPEDHALRGGALDVVSENGFPTASGLASSASGFAALAAALRSLRTGVLVSAESAHEAELASAADYARTLSASSARSIFPGFAELLPSGVAAQVATRDHMPLTVLVCVATDAAKALSSSAGMKLTRSRSMYYATWIEQAPMLFRELKACLLQRDFAGMGELLEMSALSMHASALAAGVVYFRGVTLDLYAAVRELRNQGISAWASMDAGPHVKVFVQPDEAEYVRSSLLEVPGVKRILVTKPGPGVQCIWSAEAADRRART
jgi:diphosphomevalonate decarboxylase